MIGTGNEVLRSVVRSGALDAKTALAKRFMSVAWLSEGFEALVSLDGSVGGCRTGERSLADCDDISGERSSMYDNGPGR